MTTNTNLLPTLSPIFGVLKVAHPHSHTFLFFAFFRQKPKLYEFCMHVSRIACVCVRVCVCVLVSVQGKRWCVRLSERECVWIHLKRSGRRVVCTHFNKSLRRKREGGEGRWGWVSIWKKVCGRDVEGVPRVPPFSPPTLLFQWCNNDRRSKGELRKFVECRVFWLFSATGRDPTKSRPTPMPTPSSSVRRRRKNRRLGSIFDSIFDDIGTKWEWSQL